MDVEEGYIPKDMYLVNSSFIIIMVIILEGISEHNAHLWVEMI